MVVLSGCLGTPAAVTTSESPVGDRTAGPDRPFADDQTPQTDGNVSLAPGLNESGLEDPEALIDAHRAALEETGFAFRFQANVSVGGASQGTVQRGTAESNLSSLVIRSTSVREIGDATTRFATTLWANDSTVAMRHQQGDRTRLTSYDRDSEQMSVPDETWAHLPRADLGSQATQSWLLELALMAGEYELVETERRDGSEFAVLRATEPVAAANFTDLDARVVVDSEGRVHNLTLTATAEGDAASTIRYAFELTEIGGVSVDRPAWLDEAIPPESDDGDANETEARDATPPVGRY